MAMVKPIVLSVSTLVLLVSLGCEEKKKVALDPELQKQLEEFEKKMDEKEQAYLTNRNAKTLDASLDDEQPPTSHASSPPEMIGQPGITQLPATSQGSPTISQDGSSVSVADSKWDQLEAPSKNVDYTTDGISQLQAQNRVKTDKPAEQISAKTDPGDVCQAFLKVLESGDHQTASKFLTNVAQLETARANLILEAPGGPGCHIEIQSAKYATNARKVAEVECLLYQEGASTPVSISWMMRHQYNGWKISGMSIRMDEAGASDLLSFENPIDLARIQQTVENEPTIEFNPAEELLGSPEMTANGKVESNVKR